MGHPKSTGRDGGASRDDPGLWKGTSPGGDGRARIPAVNPWLIGGPAIAAGGAGGLAAYGGICPRAQLFGSAIYRTNSPRKLAITFDDGPNPTITPKLLDLL